MYLRYYIWYEASIFFLYHQYITYVVWFLFVCDVQMGPSLPNEGNTSYYKNLPLFENLTELRLSWTSRVTHDWSEVMKMLQKCPKLQTLSIKKVCLPCLWIAIIWFLFVLLFYLTIFTNHVLSLIDSGGVQLRLSIRMGNTKIIFLNVFRLSLQQLILQIIKLWKLIFNLHRIYWRTRDF